MASSGEVEKPLYIPTVSLLEKQQTETKDGGRAVGEEAGMDLGGGGGGGVTIYIYIYIYGTPPPPCTHACLLSLGFGKARRGFMGSGDCL